jgi:hypothetical protein
VVRSCPSPVGRAHCPKRSNNFLVFGAPASIIGLELSVYMAPAFILSLAALCGPPPWRGLHFPRLCVARGLGWCDHETIEALVGFCSPSYPTPARVLLMYVTERAWGSGVHKTATSVIATPEYSSPCIFIHHH